LKKMNDELLVYHKRIKLLKESGLENNPENHIKLLEEDVEKND